MAAPDQNDAKARPLSLAFSSRDKNWLPSFKRIISGRSVIRFLTRPTRGSTSRPPVTFSRQRQAVAISPYARYVVSDNEFYSSSMSSDSQQTAYLQICDSCKSSINWYFGNLSRQVTELILHSQPIGTFLVRNSSSKYGTYALSVRVAQDAERPTAVAHYLLVKSAKSRVQIKVSIAKTTFQITCSQKSSPETGFPV